MIVLLNQRTYTPDNMANIIERFINDNKTGLLTGQSDNNDKGLLPNTDPYPRPQPPGGSAIVDVIRNYSWFSNGGPGGASEGALGKVPPIYLTEREQTLDSLLSQAMYYANNASLGTLYNSESDRNVSKFAEIIGNVVDVVSNTAEKLTPNVLNLKKAINKGLSAEDRQLMVSNDLASLVGLYITKPTGYQYVFPYFENPPQLRNQWESADASTGNASLLDTVVGKGAKVIEEIAKTLNITQPGIYIQKAKSYKMGDGPSLTVTFPLFNTIYRADGSIPGYQQNYELLWLLLYQNKPFKTSFTRVIPPKLYSLAVPGIANMPYAELSQMQINFAGTTRNLDVDIAGTVINVPIPDAYEVSLTFNSLLGDYANLMVGSGFSTNLTGNTVSTGKRIGPTRR